MKSALSNMFPWLSSSGSQTSPTSSSPGARGGGGPSSFTVGGGAAPVEHSVDLLFGGSESKFYWRSGMSERQFEVELKETLAEITQTDPDAVVMRGSDTRGGVVSVADMFNRATTKVVLEVKETNRRTDDTSPRSPGLLNPMAPVTRPLRKKCAEANLGGSQLRFMNLMKQNKNLHAGIDPSTLTPAEVARHCTSQDCWVILHGMVYDVTAYLDYHPGGKGKLMSVAGKDCTAEFNRFHSYVNGEALMGGCLIGKVVKGSGMQTVAE